MISQEPTMERLKRSVRVIKEAPQYMLADNVPGNIIAALLPDTQLVNNLSPTIQELGKKLLQAAQDGDVEEIRKLLAKGAPFTADWLGTSPLHLAAQNNHLEVCELFLRAGMCKDTRTKVERTPLHMAAYEGNYDIVECLLKHGADADAKDMLHMTPLHWAAQNGHAEIAAVLIRNGASTDVHNKFDLTPMDIALQTDRADIVEVINFTIRDPLQATNHLVEINESNDAVEPILHLNLQAEAVHSPAADGMPIETVLMDNDSNDYLQTAQEPQQEIDEVQYAEDHTATFNESMKLLQQHGITMLPDDDDTTILSTVMESGHSVVLTEAGKQALNSIKQAEKSSEVDAALTKRPNILQQQPAFKKKKIITVTADQFLAMTANNANTLRIVNGKLVQTKPASIKRIIPKAKVSPVQSIRQIGTATPTVVTSAAAKPHEVSENELELMQQLTKARALVEAYKKRLLKTEQELQKYKQKCKLLMDQNNL